jgi:hypothetical protein
MSTKNLPGGKGRPASRADNLAAICEPNIWKWGTSTYGNPKGLHGLYRDNLTSTLWNMYINEDYNSANEIQIY